MEFEQWNPNDGIRTTPPKVPQTHRIGATHTSNAKEHCLSAWHKVRALHKGIAEEYKGTVQGQRTGAPHKDIEQADV